MLNNPPKFPNFFFRSCYYAFVKITYDPRYNIAYIRLQEKGAEVETIRISDELNVDASPNGTVYGIELLNANRQLFTQDQGKGVFSWL